MGIFDLLFGSSPSQYSKVEHSLPEEKIRLLVSRVKVQSLSQAQEGAVETAIIQRRQGDGKISLFQIYEVLTKMKNNNLLSPVDRDGLVRVFGEYFSSHFSN